MKKIKIVVPFTIVCFLIASCQSSKPKTTEGADANKNIGEFFQRYYDQSMQLFPLQATANGENKYNAILPIDISESYRQKIKLFYQTYLDTLNTFDRNSLSANDQIS